MAWLLLEALEWKLTSPSWLGVQQLFVDCTVLGSIFMLLVFAYLNTVFHNFVRVKK